MHVDGFFSKQVPTALALYDRQGRLVEKTPQLGQLLGSSVDAYTFQQLLSHFQVSDREGILRRTFQEGRNIFQIRGKKALKPIDCLITRLEIEGGLHILLSCMEQVGEQWNTEEVGEVQRIEGKLLNSMAEMVVYQDLKMRIRWANQRFQKSIDRPLAEVIGQPCYRVRFKGDKPCPNCPVNETRKSQKAQENILYQDNSYRHIRSYPFYSGEKMVGIFYYMLDITEHIKMERVLQENRLKIKKLHEVSFKMDQSRDEDRVCRLTVEAAEEILDLHVCSLDLVEDGYFVVKATSTRVPAKGSRSLPVTEGIGGKCLREGKTFVGNIQDVKEARPAKESYRSVISIPIGTLGVFQAISNERDAFSVEDVELSDLLISHTREALKRIRTEKRLKYLSFHDSLTGLYNRSFFEEELKRLDTQRLLPLSIIVVDVNGLKLVNDNFGHRRGDNLLQQVAGILKQSCRREDIIARCGGDEFTILLPSTSYDAAQIICHRIKDECKKDRSNLIPIPITMALGVDTKTAPKQDLFQILNRAEDRMYEDKFQERSSFHERILQKFLSGLSRRNLETREHLTALQNVAEKMGTRLSLSQEMMMDLFYLIQMHDIGMIRLTRGLVNKNGQLSQMEWRQIKKHSEFGYRIVRSFDEYLSVADAVLAHHERWDGTGYPHGLKGEEIPFLSRIFSILDAYVSMTRKNLYRKPLNKEEALLEMKKGSGSQFDPHLLVIFLESIKEE